MFPQSGNTKSRIRDILIKSKDLIKISGDSLHSLTNFSRERSNWLKNSVPRHRRGEIKESCSEAKRKRD
ncbi:MAG: hypothetical protein A3B13_00830 [Candidatus Liptonbacteria bacterium RIFCSPLOWO2_01_FULL_45_15]|uniref:Uncharacterized protein n=1 Tax=Candidatus Liptonbacteria bacterium RIFCSPLOWO2_01_FULL_45_15 TaxID=1798649 RepID=A0A1G2CHQ9_9BACT|nr:MAG: hypothetical protein A3B13_00830 [Candidatus Liptonbacteria bacterium RIFCSPLOWO2_01_FULL_45_15]